MSSDSAIERLRELLDKRGVKHVGNGGMVRFTSENGCTCRAYTRPNPQSVDVAIMDATPEQAIAATLGPVITGETSDGYHTFNELYHHRAILFSVIVRDHSELAWKSKLHHDGTMYEGMFIVGIETPEGQATYHYDIDPYWDMFDCKELDRAPEWDGHTPDEAVERIATLGRETCHIDVFDDLNESKGTGDAWADCSECGYLLFVPTDPDSEPPNYCPNCGRKVVNA